MSESLKTPPRVRYAPSPTGYFHIGAARTVLFNWLFARQNKGHFVLRIEDTDKERSKSEFENDILNSLDWLGLTADEDPIRGGDYEPYRQSERVPIYEKYLEKLLEEGKAYYCFCAKEQLEEDRQAMMAQGLAPKYSGRCRHLPQEESQKKTEAGESSVIRFKMPETEIEFTDLIRGKIKFDTISIGDAVIAKNIREPLYNFAVVIDDALMKISHVIRGEEHLSNTPRQIAFAQALGLDLPKYAHVPLILNPDRSKMSKRHLDTALEDYRKQGYLPDALINFVALLGWHPSDDREILSRDELIKEFDLKRIQKAGAVFDTQKLDWMNAQYLKRLAPEDLADRLQEFIPPQWSHDQERLLKAISILRDRLVTLSDFAELARLFFELPDYPRELLIWPRKGDYKSLQAKIKDNLQFLMNVIQDIPETDFDIDPLEVKLMPQTESRGRGELLWPLRASLSGREASPGPFEIMSVLGKKESVERINKAIQKLV